MANIQPSTRFAGSERGTSLHSRGENEKSLMRNGIPQWTSDENRAPPTLPKAFESMLKTTTETGEIGLFSIKPSRVPQSTNAPRRFGGTFRESPSQRPRNFQSYSTTGVDDRRRLPSYARDASSEVISMYETASQKSAGRVFDEPDRSYSMTQTYSSYSLSNHRSYASLRSQPDGNSLLQRPRSPFAYPTRLKRPGFRPSSPALTDGGEVDYSRRAEIDRMPYVSVFKKKQKYHIETVSNYNSRAAGHAAPHLHLLYMHRSGNHPHRFAQIRTDPHLPCLISILQQDALLALI